MHTKPNSGKAERYVQPSLLMALLDGASYGYELLQRIGHMGFLPGDPPPGMIYRHLRQMEEDGLVVSEWRTEGAGPAKRVYTITPDGNDVLYAWVQYMTKQSALLNEFVKRYNTRQQ